MQSLLAALTLVALQEPPPEPDAFAFVDVRVLTMAGGGEVLDGRTVVVRDGRIASIGAAGEVALDDDVVAIAGEGRWLMPGLADMHVHAWSEDDHALFLANGVTTVRNLFGDPLHLGWREEIESGERLGPRFRTAGPIVDGESPIWPGSTVVADEADGALAVAAQQDAGYDFVKVYAKLTRAAYDAIVEAADDADFPVEGHVPTAVGIERVLEARQRSIEHLDGYEALLEADDSPLRGRNDFLSRFVAWNHLDASRFEAVAERTKRAGTWNCPTIVVMQKWKGGDEIEDELAAPWIRYVSPQIVAMWKGMSGMRAVQAREIRAGNENRLRFVRALHDAGARLLVGTDAGNPWVPSGFSLHDELGNFVAAGISAHDTLRIATRDAAEFCGALDERGTVEVGKLADLVLVDADPRDDLGALRTPRGVMIGGRWLDRDRLDSMLAAIAARNASPEGDDADD